MANEKSSEKKHHHSESKTSEQKAADMRPYRFQGFGVILTGRWSAFMNLKIYWEMPRMRRPWYDADAYWIWWCFREAWKPWFRVSFSGDLPGFTKEDVEVEITGDSVTISAQRKTSEEETKKDYIRRERSSRSFFRRIMLPSKVNADAAKASLSNGQLEIVLPKKEIEPKKKLVIT